MASNKVSMTAAEKAILKSLLYHDIFDFPLTKEELWVSLVSNKKINKSEFEKSIDNLGKNIKHEDGYFSLSGRDNIIKLRKNNLKYVKIKLNIAKKAAKVLSSIPTILFIGISGGLAVNDVDKNDDIDFFIITKKNSIFKTRLMILAILQLLGLRRKRAEKNPADKVCINFIVDETQLSFYSNKRDLYVAHEIAQLKPLFDRNETYSRFLEVNKWITDFLPNFKKFEKLENFNIRPNFLLTICDRLLSEWACSVFQKRIIKRHMKSEIVTDQLLAFNPNDYRVQTLNKMRLKLSELGLLT